MVHIQALEIILAASPAGQPPSWEALKTLSVDTKCWGEEGVFLCSHRKNVCKDVEEKVDLESEEPIKSCPPLNIWGQLNTNTMSPVFHPENENYFFFRLERIA